MGQSPIQARETRQENTGYCSLFSFTRSKTIKYLTCSASVTDDFYAKISITF